MKLFSTTLMVALAQGDVEEMSLMQHKVWTKDRIGAAIHRATSDLPRATEASAAEVDEIVESFTQDLMKTSTALMQVSHSQKDALLRRASQSAEVSSFIEGYINLPEETKHKVVNSALGSEDLIKVFNTMPDQHRRALLMQLDAEHMEEALAPKTKTVRSEDTVGTKVTRTETKDDRTGELLHSHTHTHRRGHDWKVTDTAYPLGQTDTATTGKHGYRHNHHHQLTSDLGNLGRTATTATASETKASHTADAIGHSHSHQTKVDARNGPNMDTVTKTQTYKGLDRHSHTHLHAGDGVFATDTRTRPEVGRETGHFHSNIGDAALRHVRD